MPITVFIHFTCGEKKNEPHTLKKGGKNHFSFFIQFSKKILIISLL